MRRFVLPLAIAAAVGIVGACTEDSPSLDVSTDTSTTAPADHNDADIAFAQAMIPHHEQAIEMAELAETRAEQGEVRELARAIKAAQGPEIEQLRQWLRQWGVTESSAASGEHGGEMHAADSGMMGAEEMAALEMAAGAEFDRMFLEGMIKHHRGAIDMANDEVVEGKYELAIELAKAIRDAQQAEITEMQKLLA